MREHEIFSEKTPAENFLEVAREELTKAELPLPGFFKDLERYDIRPSEGGAFLEAYKTGGKVLKDYLENRAIFKGNETFKENPEAEIKPENEQEKAVPLPEKAEEESETEHHQTAA